MSGLPDVIDAPRIRLVRWQLDLVQELVDAIAASLDELRLWLPWANGDVSVVGERAAVERSIIAFDHALAFEYLITEERSPREVAGTVAAYRHGPTAVGIGYWLRTTCVGRGLATAAVRALTDAVFAGLPEVQLVEIHCDAANARSEAIPRRLGFEHVADVDRSVEAPAQTGTGHVWQLTRRKWASSV